MDGWALKVHAPLRGLWVALTYSRKLVETLDLAFDLTDNIQAAYAKASPTLRRLFNGRSSSGSRSAHPEEVSEVSRRAVS
jgi:hypothetical protein